jgi:RNA polymerase sigma-70 factor (family 1)
LLNKIGQQMEESIEDFSDEDTVRHFKDANHSAFKYVFDKYYSILCYFAENLLDDAPAAEDVVEDVFINLWTKNTDFTSYRSIKAFLYTCTRNACYGFMEQRQLKNKKFQGFLSLSPTKDDDHALNEIIRAEFLRQLDEALDQLPPQCGKIMKLIYIEGWGPKRIAAELGIPVNTVKSHRARALAILRKKLTSLPLLIYLFHGFN